MLVRYLCVGTVKDDFNADIRLDKNEGLKVLSIRLSITDQNEFDNEVLREVEKHCDMSETSNEPQNKDILYMKKALRALCEQFDR